MTRAGHLPRRRAGARHGAAGRNPRRSRQPCQHRGGLGALAFGCGTTELAHILATQVMALRRPKRMLIRLDGRLGPHVTAKDVALRIIAELGVAGARGHVVEYAGAAVRRCRSKAA
jgi:3-isopropylmalate dehydratase large subunit